MVSATNLKLKIMKELKEDYERRLKTVLEELKDLKTVLAKLKDCPLNVMKKDGTYVTDTTILNNIFTSITTMIFSY